MLRRPANQSKSWRSIAMNQENATAFCNDCGAWKRITDREQPRASAGAYRNSRDARKNRSQGYVAPPLLTERLALSSRGVLRLDFRQQGTVARRRAETI